MLIFHHIFLGSIGIDPSSLNRSCHLDSTPELYHMRQRLHHIDLNGIMRIPLKSQGINIITVKLQ